VDVGITDEIVLRSCGGRGDVLLLSRGGVTLDADSGLPV
jgi:hypothetical protein